MAGAFTVAQRSRCVKAQVGCIIVSPRNTAAAVSYNGPPALYRQACADPLTSCDVWCPHSRDPDGGRRDYMDCVSSHAEANGLMQADKTTIAGGTLYVTTVPCFFCAKMIANSGITRVVYGDSGKYREIPLMFELMKQSAVEMVSWKT
jgi:dCMP deaminase